jgi:hypothetical protein
MNDSGFYKIWRDPIEVISNMWPDAGINLDHIKYDPEMTKGQYSIVRQSGGDGCLAFTHAMFREALLPLINMQSCLKKDAGNLEGIKAIKYTIGKMKHAIVYGQIYLRLSKTQKYPGLRERVRIPVNCEYVF